VNNTNLLSIITVNFNNLNGLKRTIDSVFTQSWKGFEYIVIDGGSTDGSAELISELSMAFSYSVSEPDKGIYNAMNKGLKAASGEYVYFLNSGDYLSDSGVLENVIREIKSENSLSNRKDVFVGSTRQEGFDDLISPPEFISMYSLFKSTLPHQGIFVPRERALKFPFQEEYKIIADWIQCTEILREGVADFKTLKNTKIIAINEPFGTCSELNVKLEKNLYIDKHNHIFRRFEDYSSIRFKYDQIKKVANANIINRILWYFMRIIASN
jgi:glycosyltransferase involved in cell wall biosynthesis